MAISNRIAEVAAITPQTASGHLARLASVGLIAAERQGRHRYHRLASPEVALRLVFLPCAAAHRR